MKKLEQINSTNTVVGKTKSNSRKKISLAITAFALSAALIVGSMFAYFSDIYKDEVVGIVNAGTLEIKPAGDNSTSYKIQRYNADGEGDKWEDYDVEASGTNILNPGDKFRIVGNMENLGSKSAVLQANITLDFSETKAQAMVGKVAFYGSCTENGILSDKIVVDSEDSGLTLDNNVYAYSKQVGIISGTVEVENDSDGDCLSTFDGDIVYFQIDTSVGNGAQAAKIEINAIWKAIQYRNNDVNSIDWDTAESRI